MREKSGDASFHLEEEGEEGVEVNGRMRPAN